MTEGAVCGGLWAGWNSHNPRDPEGGNLLYNDGHARWKHISQMKVLCTITGPPAVTFYWWSNAPAQTGVLLDCIGGVV